MLVSFPLLDLCLYYIGSYHLCFCYTENYILYSCYIGCYILSFCYIGSYTLCFCCADWHSAMMITLNGETEEHANMLHTGVLRQLLDEKWKTYVRVRSI